MATLCSNMLSLPQDCMMDFDGHITENTKADNACTYKQTEGYYPVVCSINKLPVYMQNRNGNTPESYNQKNIIQTSINNCSKEGISVKAFRADACCYEQDTLEYLEAQHITYYIRAENCLRLIDALADEVDWQSVMMGRRKVDVCSISEKVLGKERRIVAYRYKQSGQLDTSSTGTLTVIMRSLPPTLSIHRLSVSKFTIREAAMANIILKRWITTLIGTSCPLITWR